MLGTAKSQISVKIDGQQKEPFLERFVSKVQYTNNNRNNENDPRICHSWASTKSLDMKSAGTRSLGRAVAAKINETKSGLFNDSWLKVERDGRAQNIEKTLLLHIAKLKEKKMEVEKSTETGKVVIEDVKT